MFNNITALYHFHKDFLMPPVIVTCFFKSSDIKIYRKYDDYYDTNEFYFTATGADGCMD